MEEKAFWEKRNFIQSVWFELPQGKRGYPFDIEAVAECGKIELEEPVTILTGENGSGKSTILEAIAVAVGFNPEGGSRNFSFSTCDSHSQLYAYTHLTRGIYRPKDGYFLRAESFYNVATDIDRMDKELLNSYGGVSLHSRSHGESFLALVQNRFGGRGLIHLRRAGGSAFSCQPAGTAAADTPLGRQTFAIFNQHPFADFAQLSPCTNLAAASGEGKSIRAAAV